MNLRKKIKIFKNFLPKKTVIEKQDFHETELYLIEPLNYIRKKLWLTLYVLPSKYRIIID